LGGGPAIEQPVTLPAMPAEGWPADIAAALGQDLVAPLAGNRRLRPVLWRVLSNLGQYLSAEQAARIASLERKYFSRFFRRETGFNFLWWNRELRIRLAAQSLHQTGRTIDSIALAVGYVDPTTFTRAFKKCCGVTPQAYWRSRSRARASVREAPLASPCAQDVWGAFMTKNADKKTKNADCFRGQDADATSVDSADSPDRPPI